MQRQQTCLQYAKFLPTHVAAATATAAAAAAVLGGMLHVCSPLWGKFNLLPVEQLQPANQKGLKHMAPATSMRTI